MNLRSTVFALLLSLLVFMGCSRDEGESSPSNNCGKVTNVNFQTYAGSVVLNFAGGNGTNSYKVEYGPSGFSQGTGKSVTTSNTTLEITDLSSSTTYDFYITGICSSSESSAPYKLSSVTTQLSQCNGTTTAQFYQYDPIQTIIQIAYTGGSFSYHEVEFGPAGFTLGTGARIKGGNGESNLYFNNLELNKTYDFYVRTTCLIGDSNIFKKFTYTATPTCPKPFNLNSYVISGSCNVGLGATRGFSWSSYGSPQSYTISIVQGVTDPPGGQTFTTSNTSIAISNMYCNWKAFYVKANCSNGTGGEWAGPFVF